MRIRKLNKKDLKAFIESDEFEKMPNIPISRHRAYSQIKNPRAKEEDILLFIAYQGDEMLGYLGALPDDILINNINEHCAWMSCIWIDPNKRGQNIAYQLTIEALKSWDNRLLATRFTDSARRLYDKTGQFNYLKVSRGIRLYIRSDLATILPPKKHFYRKLKPMLQLIDFMINSIIDLRLLKKTRLENLKISYHENIDTELIEFITQNNSKELFQRGLSDLNWILENPWVLSTNGIDEFSSKYYFSSTAKLFEFHPTTIKNDRGELLAFFVFVRRENQMKIPYFYSKSGNDQQTLKVIYHHIKKWKISTLTVYNPELKDLLMKSKGPAILKREHVNRYLISNFIDVDKFGKDFLIQDGDGDSVFT